MSEATIEYLQAENAALISRVGELTKLLSEHEQEITKLQLHIVNANRKLYGSKSEKSPSEQLRLSFEVEPIVEPAPEKQITTVESHTRTVSKGRKPLPGDLPREQIIYEPSETHCPCCSKALVTIGELRSEELEKIPAQLKIIEHIRIKKACAHCKEAGVLVAPIPPTVFPIEGARPGPGLLADIVVSKYVDHLPLHRQEEMYARKGIELRRQRLCDWVAKVVELLLPLYWALKEEILDLPYIQADETTLKVKDNETPGSCHTGYLWGLHGPPHLVWFHYADSRAGSVPKELLKDYRGTVQTDAYAGYNQVFLPDTCVRLACLAHIRRAFIELNTAGGKVAETVLSTIARLYKLESNVKAPEQRLKIRQDKSKKIAEELFQFIQATRDRTLPQSPLMKALNYALNQKQEVLRIFDSGDFELDNNAIERQMRPIAIGRKNYLFAGSHDGAMRAAVLYSLLNTAKLNKVNPWQWLRDILVRVNSDKSVTAHQLLPHRWTIPA